MTRHYSVDYYRYSWCPLSTTSCACRHQGRRSGGQIDRTDISRCCSVVLQTKHCVILANFTQLDPSVVDHTSIALQFVPSSDNISRVTSSHKTFLPTKLTAHRHHPLLPCCITDKPLLVISANFTQLSRQSSTRRRPEINVRSYRHCWCGLVTQ